MARIGPEASIYPRIVEFIHGLGAADFVHIDDFSQFASMAAFESSHWMLTILAPERSPYRQQESALHSFHVWTGAAGDFELLRHAYTTDGRSVTITESVPLIVLRIELPTGDPLLGISVEKRLGQAASWLLSKDPSFSPQEPYGFTSNPGLPVDRVTDWAQRIDGSSGTDYAELIIYKKDGRRASDTARNLTLWFEPKFRSTPPGSLAPPESQD